MVDHESTTPLAGAERAPERIQDDYHVSRALANYVKTVEVAKGAQELLLDANNFIDYV